MDTQKITYIPVNGKGAHSMQTQAGWITGALADMWAGALVGAAGKWSQEYTAAVFLPPHLQNTEAKPHIVGLNSSYP